MLIRGSLVFFLVFFLVLSFNHRVHADDSKANNSANLEKSLGQVVQVFQNDDCDNTLVKDTAQNLVDACKEAHETPEIAATRGNFICSFDLENYVISAKTSVISPEYHVAPNGGIKQIVKGDLSVTAKECQNMTKEQNTAAGKHAASADLCYSYFPDKNFAPYQEKAQCPENRKPASVTPAPSSPAAPSSDEIDEESSDTDIAATAEKDLGSYEMAVK